MNEERSFIKKHLKDLRSNFLNNCYVYIFHKTKSDSALETLKCSGICEGTL